MHLSLVKCVTSIMIISTFLLHPVSGTVKRVNNPDEMLLTRTPGHNSYVGSPGVKPGSPGVAPPRQRVTRKKTSQRIRAVGHLGLVPVPVEIFTNELKPGKSLEQPMGYSTIMFDNKIDNEESIFERTKKDTKISHNLEKNPKAKRDNDKLDIIIEKNEHNHKTENSTTNDHSEKFHLNSIIGRRNKKNEQDERSKNKRIPPPISPQEVQSGNLINFIIMTDNKTNNEVGTIERNKKDTKVSENLEKNPNARRDKLDIIIERNEHNYTTKNSTTNDNTEKFHLNSIIGRRNKKNEQDKRTKNDTKIHKIPKMIHSNNTKRSVGNTRERNFELPLASDNSSPLFQSDPNLNDMVIIEESDYPMVIIEETPAKKSEIFAGYGEKINAKSVKDSMSGKFQMFTGYEALYKLKLKERNKRVETSDSIQLPSKILKEMNLTNIVSLPAESGARTSDPNALEPNAAMDQNGNHSPSVQLGETDTVCMCKYCN